MKNNHICEDSISTCKWSEDASISARGAPYIHSLGLWKNDHPPEIDQKGREEIKP
jgi:hypothetical protein